MGILAVLAAVLLGGRAAAREPSSLGPAFERDLARLASYPHRLAGTEPGRDASAYVMQRLREAGVDEVLPLEMPVWQTMPRLEQGPGPGAGAADGGAKSGVRLTVRDANGFERGVVPLFPCRPNLVCPPVTPAGGLTGPLRYAGRGSAAEVAAAVATPGDAAPIVVLDYDVPQEAWERAFALGAAAVVFRAEAGVAAGEAMKSVPAPMNLPRFFAEVDPGSGLSAGLDLTAGGAEATLEAAVPVVAATGRSVVAVIEPAPGATPALTAAAARRRPVVLAADLDSFGSVPERGPGARNAANAALLLEAARRLAADPPPRRVVLVFLDNAGRGMQGARTFYAALTDDPARRREAIQAAARDLAASTLALRTLPQDADAARGLPASAAASLRPLLAARAAWARADAARELRLLRLEAARGDEAAGAMLPTVSGRVARWDAVRRHVHEAADAGTLFTVEAAPREGRELLAAARAALRARSTAAARRQVELGQQEAVQAAASGRVAGDARAVRVALHASLDLSGEGPSWGVVAGSDAGRVGAAWSLSPEADAPGYHQRVLGHFAAAAAAAGDAPAFRGLDAETLRDPAAGRLAVPGPLVHSGFLAGTHGFFNVAFATCHDARRRDGHPGDTLAALDAAGFAAQGDAALRLFVAGLNRPGLPDRAPFADKAIDNRAGTRRPAAVAAAGAADDSLGVPVGPVVQQRVAGGLAEDRPAPGAVVALFPMPADPANAWNSLARRAIPSYEPARMVVADGAGRFDVVAAHADLDRQLATLGATHDARGALTAVSTQERVGGTPAAALRTDLLGLGLGDGSAAASGSAVVTLRPDEPTAPGRFTVLLGAAGSRPRPADALVGQAGPFGFYHLTPGLADSGVRVFQPEGPLLLPPGEFAPAAGPADPAAAGSGRGGVSVLLASAGNLWSLNESRLAALRARGILRGDLERLHRDARAALDNAAGGGEAAPEAARLAFALGQRVYNPLRAAMDDLVNAVVLLLALAVPFAFFGERLLIGAKGIRGRVAGFAVCFGLTFAALYALHPGFAVASTPIIVFLAFAILLLSGLVIVLLISKFRVQLAKLHGEGGQPQNAGQVAALLAAVQMGISTMRRRKTRTALTTLTVVVLTFTVLCFAGFERRLGVGLAAVGTPGPGTPTDAVLVRRVDGGPLPRAAAELAGAAASAAGGRDASLLGGAAGGGVGAGGPAEALATWRIDPPGLAEGVPGGGLALAREDGTADGRIRCVVGIDPRLPRRWPALSRALASATASGVGPERFTAATLAGELSADGVFLNPAAARSLRLEVGDRFRLAGRRVRLAGVLDADRIGRLRHVDGQPVLPVLEPGRDRAAGGSSAGRDAAASAGGGAAERLGVAEVAFVGVRLAEELGGRPDGLTVFPAGGIGVAETADALATALPQPAWSAGAAGLERRVLTTLTSVSGAAAIVVPLALGGLIVFGTLLGSISDRKQEIYTFSALGLAPRHIGALFLAEGAVYAVVGGLGGQLLALFLARVSATLAQRGLVPELPVNFASGNALFATGVVMAVVMLSSLYPAAAAARSANPGLVRRWRLPAPVRTPGGGDRLDLVFPFTVSAADMGGVRGFLAEHFRSHDDAGIGRFACSSVAAVPGEGDAAGPDGGDAPTLLADVALAPFDLGVTQRLRLWSEPSDIAGVDRVRVVVDRLSGTRGDFARLNKPFFAGLRRQFLLWRTLPDESREGYRREAAAG
ncbi:ABC transporter permease [Phycisphaera mikurensis]|uniref:FtsX-like permease family protein n=1 Tax=Phycisphaera mikurensis (strain NBRC 102666 / KCTC 22515 / FYK2301M01) TaxID=1142394 RepID=I0IA73_PHYMF|nr:ABC transporter permease [Phycisphaera mikurensis]MBB6441837.1 hypothetical protein [Phycisphaera mikurensis]BAM02161.1 hypothetical protein PSMK_00020 [Phycisphaera mikurensis NBRC 102666]